MGFHVLMVLLGLLLIVLAFWLMYYKTGFLGKIGGLLAPIALLIVFLGVLLLAVPGFFSPLPEMIKEFLK